MIKENQPRIFLSYARQDATLVGQLYSQLESFGFHPWMDTRDILPGEDWKHALLEAIRLSPFFIACISKNSANRRGIIQVELREALELWRQKLDSDIYLIPVRLEECDVPDSLTRFQWVDIFAENGLERLIKAIRTGIQQLGIIEPVSLRYTPTQLIFTEALKEIQDLDLFDSHRNWAGKGIQNQFELIQQGNDEIVFDHTTKLFWEKSGSERALKFSNAQKYITRLNTSKYGGYFNWRLPTLAEAMSLLCAQKNETGHHTNSVFSPQQHWIWTCDIAVEASIDGDSKFVVGFRSGNHAFSRNGYSYHVRAVRSIL